MRTVKWGILISDAKTAVDLRIEYDACDSQSKLRTLTHHANHLAMKYFFLHSTKMPATFDYALLFSEVMNEFMAELLEIGWGAGGVAIIFYAVIIVFDKSCFIVVKCSGGEGTHDLNLFAMVVPALVILAAALVLLFQVYAVR